MSDLVEHRKNFLDITPTADVKQEKNEVLSWKLANENASEYELAYSELIIIVSTTCSS